jgi:hypothetical protein
MRLWKPTTGSITVTSAVEKLYYLFKRPSFGGIDISSRKMPLTKSR